MKRATKRKLAFELLENKCTPSTVLLAFAPLDDSFHSQFEQARQSVAFGNASGAFGNVSGMKLDVASNWQFQISSTNLLQFVHDNTNGSATTASMVRPDPEQCRAADAMMKLGDHDLRALVISDSLQVV